MIRLHPTPTAVALALASCFPAAAQTAPSGATQEIVVTAQKRLQAASKVPVALSVITGEDIKDKGITTAANLTDYVPNVQIGLGNVGGMEITIRGIGNTDNTEVGDPQAAFHVDGIYIGRPQGAGATFFDLERVEVLRGPQGTLYGRNANAGAVNVITRKPGNKLQGQVDLAMGNYKARNLDAMLNVPVSEAFALRAVVSAHKHDGYSDSATAANGFARDRDDMDNVSGRLQGLLKFSPQASLLVALDTSHNRAHGQASFDIDNGLPSNRSQNPLVQGRTNSDSNGLMGEFKIGLGMVDFTYLYAHRTSKRDEEGSYGNGPGGFWVTYGDKYKQDSHELRLSSNDAGPLQWVAGLYAFKEVGRNIDLPVIVPGVGQVIRFVQDPAIGKSNAAFGQATYEFAPTWRGTLGLRQTRDEKSRKGVTLDGGNAPIGNIGNDAKGTWSQSTYRLGLEHDLSKAELLYASVSTGYKAGGFNNGNSVVGDANFNPNLYYKPEEITAYEAGLKGRYLDGRLQFGISAFYYDYVNLQKSAVVNTQLNTQNSGKAKVTGLEIEGRAALSASGRLNFALGLLSAKYTDYVTPNGQDFHGQKLDRAPTATLTLGYTHNWDLANGARISAYLGSRYTSSYVVTDTGTGTQAARILSLPAAAKSDMTLTYSAVDDKWNVQAFAKNLENNSTVTGMQTVGTTHFGFLSEPRTLGLRGSFKF